jgi:hypothetical protein
MRYLLFFAAALAALAQSNGRVAGQIQDTKQAGIPGARVTVEDPERGFRREVMADGAGRYSAPDLPIGRYQVKAEAPGFAARRVTGLTLTVGAVLALDVQLEVAGVTERIEVVASVSPIDPQQAAGALVANRPLVELPVNGRDFARFSLLTPGAVGRTASISDLAFNGMHPSHNNFTIDGIDASRGDQPVVTNGFERGGRLLTGSLDSLAEFRIQTSNYRAEYGRAAGTVITVASRAGTNAFHGALFEYFRNSALDARNYFNTTDQLKDPFRYNNFGGNLGGRIWRDRTFFFTNYEGSRQRLGARGTGTVPSALMRQQTLAASPNLGFLLENFPLGTTPTANPLVDSYTRSESVKINEDTGSLRLDHNASPHDRIFARLNLNNSTVDGPLFSILPSALGLTDFQLVASNSRNAALNWQRVISPASLLELTAGLQRTMTNGSSETPFPQVNITGLTVVPGSRRLNLSNANVFQYGGTFSHVRGSHTIKAGATLWRTQVNSWTTSVASVSYLSLQDFVNNRMGIANLTAGTFGNGIRQTHVGLFVQDNWQVRPGLTVDYGIRYDVTTPNHDNQDRLQSFDTRSGQLSVPGGPWYRADRNNFAPRLGIAWQLRPRLAIRTGYGLFFQQFAPGFGNNIAQNTLTGNSQLVRQSIPDLAWPLDPFIARGTAALPVANGLNWDKPDLYAQQWNFTLLTALPGSLSLETAYVGNRGTNLRRSVNLNWLNPDTGRRAYPAFSRVNIDYANGQSNYHGLQLHLRRQMAQGWLLGFAYTYAKAMGDVTDAVVGNTEPQDFRCFACEYGVASTDVRQIATVNALWDLPWAKGNRWLGGWKLSGLAMLRSGISLNVTQPRNTVGSDNATNQRPDRVLGVSPYLDDPSASLWLNPAAFQVAPQGRYGNSARQPLYGPGFFQADVSLLKDFRLGESSKLQFRTETFNIFNRPNFAQPNTVVGTPNYGRIFNTLGRTIGSGTSRQIQMVLRLEF